MLGCEIKINHSRKAGLINFKTVFMMMPSTIEQVQLVLAASIINF
jgi:hypothetical protein